MIDANTLRVAFREKFGGREPRLFAAPGRVNLIGEHTDYNEGFVFPMAIDRATVAAARENGSRRVRVHSLSVNETAEFDLDHPGPRQRGIWLDYVEGVAQSLLSRGLAVRGVDMLLASDVPVGAGLSSSAALEIAVGSALLGVSEIELSKVDLALAGQQAEHEYVGTKCGIMDQLVAACGSRGHALLIDCRSLELSLIPLDTTETTLAICDTRVRHELSSSEYNTRRAECERGVEMLSQWLPGIRSLRDVSTEDFQAHAEKLPALIRSRCRHVVTENARTLAAADALRANDFEEMGRLMYASHESLRVDYEVSCRELDVMVEIARSIEGVYGARMTGGGFGGCSIHLVRRAALERFQERMAAEYHRSTGKSPNIYFSEPSDGAREIAEPLSGGS
ncbi:MAG TPA: galactokinase [Pyrinomonadaceae bacterium]